MDNQDDEIWDDLTANATEEAKERSVVALGTAQQSTEEQLLTREFDCVALILRRVPVTPASKKPALCS